MTIYNSQRVNNDPLPWMNPEGERVSNKTRMGSVYYHSPEDAMRYKRHPRPKYDNNVNRALEFFRLDATYPAIAKWYSLRDRAKIFITFWDDPVFYFNDREFTAEEMDHAHRVLTKLINVYKETA